MANEAGWYPDPWQPARRRWWDGAGWTDHTWDPNQPVHQAMQRPVQPTWMVPPDPRRDLADERNAAVWAKRAFFAVFLGQVLGGLVSTIALSNVIDDIHRSIDTNGADQPTFNGLQLISTPLSILALVALIGIALWTYRAATVASKLDYPAVHSPGAAIAGWLVPIINFWFPYQSVRDCLAPGNPERRAVGRWWLLYLIGTYGWFAVLVISVFGDVSVAIAVALPVAVASALALLAAQRVVDAITADHAAAIERIVTR
ncbi:MAG TPA: DUF4328 domain-containing protein [Acidimicrobiales bacterium]|jgi:hypothetical protein